MPATIRRRIQDWLGHRSVQHTNRYRQLSAAVAPSHTVAHFLKLLIWS
jgi:integrase